MWEALKSNVLRQSVALEDGGSYSPILICGFCRIFLFAVQSIVYRSNYCQTLSNVAKLTAPNDLCECFIASVGKEPNFTKELRTQQYLFRLLNK